MQQPTTLLGTERNMLGNSVDMWFRGLVTRCIGVRVKGLGFVFWLADLGRKAKGLIRTSKSHKRPRHPGSRPGNGFAD